MNAATIYMNSTCGLLLMITLLVWTDPASAQQENFQMGTYVRTHVGLSGYWGDLEDPTSETSRVSAPAIAWEVGFPIYPSFTLEGGLEAGNYPRLDPLGTWHTWRFTSHIQVRHVFRPTQRLSPYAHVGAHITGGNHPDQRSSGAYGPSFGGGLRYAVNRGFQVFAGTNVHLSFPDEALDGWANDRSFDMLSSLNVGIQFSLSGTPSLRLTDATAADSAHVSEEVHFSVSADNPTSRPVSYTWDFGDGTTATGRTVRHVYQRAGVYEVTVNGSSGDRRASTSMNIIVAPETDTANPRLTKACAEAIESADMAYRTRNFAAALDTLQPCLSNEAIAVEQKVAAYRLRTLIHLKQGEVEEAKNTLVQIFAIKPDYEADTVHDPPSYVSLVSIVKKQIAPSSSGSESSPE